MSTTAEFLARLTALDVRVWLDGEHIRVSAPAGALDGGLRDELRSRKQELRDALGTTPPGSAAPANDSPLSFAQQRLWFFQQLEPESSVYNLGATLELTGPLDVSALESSIGAIVARHEILRATYTERSGEPRIDVQSAPAWALKVIDLSNEPAERQSAGVEAAWRDQHFRPFNLERDVPLRTVLVRLAPQKHRLIVTFHHIASDGASMVIFARELAANYAASRDGSPAPLPPVVQYPELARRERNWIASPEYHRTLTYWKEQLSGDIAPLMLPLDAPRPAVQTFRGDAVHLTLSPATAEHLRALGRRHRATLSMTLLAAFDAVLHRHSGDTDILIGVPVANRDRAETQNPIGMFVNTVVVRASLDGNPAFGELLDRVRQSSIGAFAHQELPFARLVEELRPQRDLSRTPLFQAMFNMFTLEVDQEIKVGDLRITAPAADAAAARTDVEAKFDVTLYVHERADGIHCMLAYNADLFARERMERIARHFARIAETVVADDAVRIGDIPLEEPASARPVAHAMRPAPFTALPGSFIDGTIIGRFHEVAQRQPSRTAVVAADATWTYAELEQHAQRIAVALAAAAEKKPARVALLCGRGATMVAAVLGVMESGAAYVPLDPSFPAARLSALLDEADATVIVAEPQYAALARAVAGTARDVVLTDAAESATRSAASRAAPADAAYLLFTSGSSGRPKGVAQTHQNVLSYVRAYVNALELTPADRMTLVASYTFDASVVDIFSALLSGATLCPLDVRAKGVHELAREMHDQGVTIFHSTPTLYRALVPHLERADVAGIRAVVLGGEKVFAADVDAFRERFAGGAVFVNLYGATEATIAMMGMFTGSDAPREQGLSVGVAIPGFDVVLLDENGGETAVRGEIALRSRHVAPGYWNAPDLTSAVFSSATDGVRTYRTGDLATRRPDGRFDVLGRRDFQVKIRGLRIELGEIEMALRAHAAVRESVVVADSTNPASPVIIGFVTLAERGAANSAGLQAHLAQTLPEYMLPAAIVILNELPLTRTGKVDRRALPTAHELGLDARQEFVAPRDAVEEMLAEIWSDVLGRRDIGVHDNFFALGGHSLNATQVMARLRSVAGTELPLRALFTAPTIDGLAAALRDAASQGAHAGPRLHARADRPAESPLSFSQERMWYLQQLIPEGTAYNMMNAVIVTGSLDRSALLAALADLRARHQMLRTTFSAPDGEPRQHVDNAPGDLPVIEKDFSALPVNERLDAAQAFAADIAMQSFDLERGPVWRFLIARMDPDRHLIVMVMHHIIGDLWSFGVMQREFGALYLARSSGNEPRLAPVDVEYTDYAAWQREWLSGDRLRDQLAFWMTRLAKLDPIELPIDRARPAVVTANGSRRRFEIGGDVVRRARVLGVREGATPFMTFFAAFAAVLYRYTGQTDFGIGVPIANRTHVALEGLVGTFVNTLVHRNDLSGAPTFRELLRRVRATALDAFAHQDLPFERLVRDLAPQRDASRSPVFQVLFNVANAPVEAERVSGFEARAASIPRQAAQFELSVGIHVGETIEVMAGFNTDLFDAGTIERFLRNYATFVSAALREPDRRITELELIPADDRAAILEGINATDTPVPPGTVVSMFETWAKETPDATAIEFGKISQTYGELNTRANQLAHVLAARGVVPGDLVGLCLPRTPDLVVALLAVLKTGAAYVPIDPAFPPQRVKFMIDDSRVRVVVADESSRDLVQGSDADRVFLDGDRGAIDAAPAANIDAALTSDDRAYVIYTSGSTGTPKGVEVTHGGLMNFLTSMQRSPGFAQQDALLAVTTISFDIAGLELYVPLISGATVILAVREVAADGRLLRQLLEQRKPTLMQATPATWRALIDAGWTASPGLKALCGGEALPRDLAAELVKRVGELWNMYGPTETTIWSTTLRVTDTTGVIPVGRPIANTRVYVLDPQQKLLPVGVPGELYIGGAGVARGYLNRPELTAERFLPDPFSPQPGARMYRTGDKARLLDDGTIEHLGRFDEQVKLRGYRIELGEIEAAIAASPAVRQTAVAIRQDRLTAFVVFEQGHDMTATEMRSYLRQTLPDYMVPSLVVPLDALPLTPNGKIDRKALPDPLRGVRTESEYVAPATQTEQAIATIWQELLGVNRVSTADNFFELGGHSLLSMKAVHEIHQRTGWRPDARALFFRTLGQIAAMRPDSGTTNT